ncbi:hypothetical protein [Acidianus bottle-shaped virus 3 strain ABV3]|uniref:Glycosyltransferase n=1 Tax=Acidianus bottle-shaped virus 3 strain ABV3 TaxID=1732174 RepID=A0A0N9P735_9VIRU|nr:glycosyltransferase [Acidianus bottle-shaped virus 3 strain ABV3]ALG96829.1 hypothetical protein [Acidianus bottle-shaped virus 3 strain ABV3]
MSIELTFITTTNSGSYDRLASRQASLLEKKFGIKSEIIRSAQMQKSEVHGSHVIIYTTFNILPQLYKIYERDLRGKEVIALIDSALYTIPYLIIEKLLKEHRIYTTSMFNQENFEKLGIKIPYVSHFVPDPNTSGRILEWHDRNYDFITVGINETDFDRKGHYWNWIVEKWGFKTVRVCSNWCPSPFMSNVSDDKLYELYAHSKWYLATSHAETPHLPLIEAYAFGTPGICLNAHEFRFICRGITFEPAYVNVKGMKNFYFAEIDASSFISAVGESRDVKKFETYSQIARQYFEEKFSMNKRLDEFMKLVGLD